MVEEEAIKLSQDSQALKIEKKRMELEKVLGFNLFQKAYGYIKVTPFLTFHQLSRVQG